MMNSTSDLRSSVNELISNIKSKSKSKSEAAGDIAEISPNGEYVRYSETVSEGGGGLVKTAYIGFDQDYGREVTWNKVSLQDPSEYAVLDRLHYSQIELLKSLKHDNIIKCFSSWVDEDEDENNKTINIITESFTSGSLRRFRQKHTSVDMKAIKNWATQILQGLNYLHTHNPPIVHNNLNCHNVFVNGNTAEVKLGYLGSASEYNNNSEAVDIYSFGMCMLELVTCEWDPYGESKNQAHDEMYKNVTLGIKPASIGRVKNLEVKQFIEKCFVPPSLTLSAAELLEDPFLSSGNSKKQLPNSAPTSLPNKVSSQLSSLELMRSNETSEFRLRGEKNDDNSISLTLCIADLCGTFTTTMEFPFSLDTDTALLIADDMVEQLDMSKKDVAELIDTMLITLVPGWKTSLVTPNNGLRSASDSSDKQNTMTEVRTNSGISSVCSGSSKSNDMSFLSVSSAHKDQRDELKQELDAIDMRYTQHFLELMRKRDNEINNAKNRWMS